MNFLTYKTRGAAEKAQDGNLICCKSCCRFVEWIRNRYLSQSPCSYEKKLTLTVEEEVISSVRRRAKRKGVTVSKMFEEVMGSYHDEGVETDQQRAAKRLLLALEKSESIRSKEDQKLLNEYVQRKFA